MNLELLKLQVFLVNDSLHSTNFKNAAHVFLCFVYKVIFKLVQTPIGLTNDRNGIVYYIQMNSVNNNSLIGFEPVTDILLNVLVM